MATFYKNFLNHLNLAFLIFDPKSENMFLETTAATYSTFPYKRESRGGVEAKQNKTKQSKFFQIRTSYDLQLK